MNTVLLTIVLIPIIEIYLFIKIGSQIGAFNTISLIFITAIIGVIFMVIPLKMIDAEARKCLLFIELKVCIVFIFICT